MIWMGCKDLIIAASGDGILISDKERSGYMKPYVEKIETEAMYAEGETVKKTIYIFPPEWAGTFGKPITSIAQVGFLQQEHYSGNWDVLRPAAEIEEMNTFTADGLNALLHEAEKIMEG